jgi:hypothetical protein
MPEDIAIHQKPLKMALLALMAVAMTAASVAVAVIFYKRGETGSFPFLMGCIGTLFFFGCLILIVPKIFDRRPAIDLSGEGLLAPAVSSARIAWSDLLAVRFHRYQGQPILELILSEQAERSLPFTRMVTWTRAANRRLGFHGVCLSLGQLERAPEDVAELLGTRLRQGAGLSASPSAA